MSTSTSKPSAISKATVLKDLGDNEEKAHVKEETVITRTYTEDKAETKTKGKKDQNENNTENLTLDRQGVPFHFQDKAPPQDRLAQMFTDMKEVEDEENELFVALITRLPDLMTDNFRRPCMQAISFAPLQITSNYLLSFVPLLQKHNNNSGGRFKIVICDVNGEPLDIGISGLMIADPVIDEKPITETTAGIDTIAVIDRIMQQSDQRFAELLRVVKDTNKEDEFTALAKEKLKRDILEPHNRDNNGFNPEAAIERAMTSIAVTEAMAKGMARMFDRNSDTSEKEQGLLASLLSNEMFVDRASQLLENVTNNIAIIANNVTTRSTNPQQPIINPNPNGYPPLPYSNTPTPQPEPTQENNMTIEEQEKLIKEIIEELESERPLDNNNEFLIRLKEQHATQYQGLLLACKMLTFDTLMEQLEASFPNVFDDFYSKTNDLDDNGEPIFDLNERGKKIENRLKQFYEFMKQQS